MPIRSTDISKVFKPGELVFIDSRRHGSIQAVIIKYIPHGEWYCSFFNSKTQKEEQDYFNHDEID